MQRNHDLFALNLRNLRGLFETNKIKVEDLSPQIQTKKTKFLFGPEETIEKQKLNFKSRRLNDLWNGEIVFLGFKGAFKTEYWGIFEEALRQVRDLSKLTFVDTQLDIQHLVLLRSLIQWVNPKEFSLQFRQNELDDIDLEVFLNQGLLKTFGPRMQQFLVVSNPGVFKGHFVKQFKHNLSKMSKTNLLYNFHFLKNREYKSVGFIRILKTTPHAETSDQVLKFGNNLKETYYYDLSLRNCFTEANEKAFQHLIEQTYHEDKLEQLESLDVGGCILGTQALFVKMCQRLSTSKGLLSLGLSGQQHIQQAYLVKSLMGDRYDQLRVNHIDLGDNEDMVEGSFKIFSDSLISMSIKTLNFQGSMSQHVPVLVKMFFITKGFMIRIEELKKIVEKKKFIPKLQIKKLDLSSLECYNRIDLVEAFLLALVFNEFSACKELIIQNLDVGRLVAYLDALDKFESHIKLMKKSNSIYANYTPRLSKIEMNSQRYLMEADKINSLFRRLFFTKSTDLLQIHKICIKNSCLQMLPRQAGFLQFLESLTDEYELNKSVKYTVKHLIMESSSIDGGQTFQLLFKNIVFTQNFQLKSLSLEQESIMDEDWVQFLELGQIFLQQIPMGQFWSLKKLTFKQLGGVLNLFKLVELIIFSEKMELQELTIVTQDLVDDDESKNSLKEKANGWSKLLTLKKLHFGQFYSSTTSFTSMIEILVIHPMSSIQELFLHSPDIQDSLPIIKERIIDYQTQGHKPLNQLKSLIIEYIPSYDKEQWENFADIFIYGDNTYINSLEFRNMNISSDLSKGLDQSKSNKQEKKKNSTHEELAMCFSLNSLIFEGCTFEDEIFSLLYTTENSGDQVLHIINGVNVDIAVESFKKTYESNTENLDLINFYIRDLILDGTVFEVDENFEWFFRTIILNKKFQKLQNLSMKNCQLKDSHFVMFNDIVKELKAFKFDKKRRGYFKFKKFNFDDNYGISDKNWKDFFDNLFTVYDASEDQKENIGQEDVELKIIEEEQRAQEKIDFKDKKCEDVAEFIINKRLSVPAKLLANPSMYTITPPLQLLRLELTLSFSNDTQEVKQRLYSRIFKGLIIYPGSKLRELSLSELDLSMFLISTEESLQIVNSQKENSQIQLRHLKLSNISNDTDILMRHMAELYIQNESISLEALILECATQGNFYQYLSECLEEALFGGQICALNILKLTGVSSNLSIDQTLHFFKTVVFNKSVPLQQLEIGAGLFLDSEDTLTSQLNQHLVSQNYNCPLNDVSIKQLSGSSTFDTSERLLPIIFEGVLVKLNKFSYQNDECQCLSFGNLYDNKLVNFSITEFSINCAFRMSSNLLKLLYQVRPKLKSLILLQLSTILEGLEEINQFLETEGQQIKSQKEPCSLNLSFANLYSGEGNQIMEKFVYNEGFQWSDVIINGYEAFAFMEKIQFYKKSLVGHLRYLKIDSTLIFSSQEQLSEDGLKLIGDQLIYDERSILEELCLIQSHLKVPGIKALTQGAKIFRDKIEYSKTKQTASLSLKRFCIYYSLYIMEEGAEILSRDLIFFQYITIERLELQVTNWNSTMAIQQCSQAQSWLQFQKTYDRERPYFSIKYLDWGRNELVQSKEAWFQFCDTFVFSDNTPLMEVLNIHFMSLKDEQIEYICEKADDYFRWKPYNYTYPVKRLNFSLNTALSAKGWGRISERFFFSQHVNLEELNLLSTTLDSEEKLSSIYSPAFIKAGQQKSKKLTLHTLLCYNISLKQLLADIMNPRPDDYLPLKDQPLAIEQCYSTGLIDGMPESLGLQASIINKTLYNSKNITNNKWDVENMVRFSEYHLEVASGLLRPLSEFFNTDRDYCGHFPIDITTCDQLCTIFKYRQNSGDPYPYQLLFTPDACKFYMQPSCQVRVINFIQTNTKNAEQMNQFQVLQIWEHVKSTKSSLDIVYIDYRLDDDLVDKMIQQGYNERDVVNLVRLFPPSSIRLQDTLTLQALKAIYTIMYDNYQFNYANVLFDKDIFLNVGIGYSLRELVYRTNPTRCIGRCFKIIFYRFFDLFVFEVPKYSFTEQIRDLNNFLSTQRRYFIVLITLTLIFYVICIFAPYGWQHYYDGDTGVKDFDLICYNGITTKGYYTYFVFAVFSFFAEAFMYWSVSQIIPNHIKGLIETDEPQAELLVETKTNFQEEGLKNTNEISNKQNPKKGLSSMVTILSANITDFSKSKSGRRLGYLKDLLLGQLAKLHLYQDINFIMLCYYCRLNTLAIIALSISMISVYFQLYALCKFIITQCLSDKSKSKLLSTQFINDFFEISSIGRNIALSTVLDSVAPFNVTVIPNNFIIRKILPQLAGKSMSNSVKGYVFKFAFEDVPQITLQLYFVINRALNPLSDPTLLVAVSAKGTLGVAIIITIINTLISVLVSFIKFMSIRPYSLSQTDYDALALKKTKVFLETQLKFVDKEFEILQALTGSTEIIYQAEEEQPLIYQ